MIINLDYLNQGGGGSGSGVTPSEVNALINSAITQGEYINNAEYISSAKTIVLYQDSTEVATIDATAFIKDGMVDSVTVSGSILTIVFNTDAGKEPINVDLSDVVDLSNYYTKTDVDAIASGKADTSAVTQSLSTKQDSLVSGTNIKTINNESLLGSGNIDIQGGGGMDDDMELLLSSALNDINDYKADKSELSKYQKKGDYATNDALALKANSADVVTNVEYLETQKVTSWSLNELNERFGGLKFVSLTQSEYDQLATKDSATIYFIKDNSN